MSTASGSEDDGTQSKLGAIAGVALGLMIMGLFLGSVHLFTSITGEKQNHVTESILSAIPVQRWIDGKCVGLAFVAAATLLLMVASSLIANQVYGWMHEPIQLHLELVEPGKLTMIAIIGLLGFLMWFAFFAAVAATIEDPNTSSRGMFMFLPAMATGVAFIGADDPDAFLYQLLSMFPLTAPGAMPMRLIRGQPAFWEIAVALLAMAAATWLFRRLAAKVFATAMLMRGKDLAWAEVWRSFRSA